MQQKITIQKRQTNHTNIINPPSITKTPNNHSYQKH